MDFRSYMQLNYRLDLRDNMNISRLTTGSNRSLTWFGYHNRSRFACSIRFAHGTRFGCS